MRNGGNVPPGSGLQGPGERPGGLCGEGVRGQEQFQTTESPEKAQSRGQEGWPLASQARDDHASGAGEPKRAAGLGNQGRQARTNKPAISSLPGSVTGPRALSPSANQTPMKTLERLKSEEKEKRENIKRARRGRAGEGRGESKQGKDVRGRERRKVVGEVGICPSVALGKNTTIPRIYLACWG